MIATLALIPATADAQLRRPRAALTPIVEASGVHPGTATRVAVEARLPDKSLHVQSDRPRDPTFIPTVLTIDAPPGVTFDAIAYPPARELKQEGLPEPLDVFESEFAIGVRLHVASSVPPGSIVVPGRLRYQACDDKVCYPPTTAPIEFALQVVPASTAITTGYEHVFKGMTFTRIEAVAVPIPSASGGPPP